MGMETMDPLGAIRLRDERNKSGFAAFTQGLDDYGNMDTARKEKSVWERYLGEQNKENAEDAEDPYAASKKLWEVHRNLANIHRNAKLRGLNYDQSIIDEQTAKPERDRQHELAVQEQKDKQANREFDLKKSAWDKLTQEQTQIRTRLNGNIASLPAYYAQLASSANAQEQDQLKQVIKFIESQIKADNSTLEEVEAKMDQHDAPDYYIRRKRGEFGTQGNNDFMTTEEKANYARVAEELLNGSTDQPNESVILEAALKSNLNPEQFTASVERALKKNRGNVDYKSGVTDSNLGQKGKTLSNQSAEASAKQNEAATQRKIVSLGNTKTDINNFLSNPSYTNFKLIEKRLGKYDGVEGDLSKLPYIGNLIGLLQSTDEQKFTSNKNVILNDARNTLREIEAEIGTLAPPKKLPKGDR